MEEPLSEQLKSAIATKQLKQMNDLLEQIAQGRLEPDSADEDALLEVLRKLRGSLQHSDSRSWVKSRKIDKTTVSQTCKRAFDRVCEKLGVLENSSGGKGLRRINTSEKFALLKNKTRP